MDLYAEQETIEQTTVTETINGFKATLQTKNKRAQKVPLTTVTHY